MRLVMALIAAQRIMAGKWQGTFGAIWPGGVMRDSAGAAAEHLHDPDDDQ